MVPQTRRLCCRKCWTTTPRAAEAAEAVEAAEVQGAVEEAVEELALLVALVAQDFEAVVVTPRTFAPCVVLFDDQYAPPCLRAFVQIVFLIRISVPNTSRR